MANVPSQLVDRWCEELFLSPRARERDDNLVFVREGLLRSEADLASLLDLYAKVRQGRGTRLWRVAVPNDEANPLVSFLRLSGIVRAVGGELQVRNRIYQQVFDREWIRTHMPDAELRRQRTAYRRGLARALALSAVIVAAMGGLLLNSIHDRQSAYLSAAIARASLQARDVQLRQTRKQRDLAKRAEKAARKAQRDESVQRATADNARREADVARGQAEENARAARSEKQRAQVAALRALELLARHQAERGVKQLEAGNSLGLLDLVEARRNAEKIPALKEAIAGLWADWHQACAGRLVSAVGHDRAVRDIRFSPDGTRLATASADGTVMLWDTRTWQPATRPLRHDSAVDIVVFSPDGKRLATAAEAETRVRLWNAATGAPWGRPLEHNSSVNSVAFHPDGKLLATGCADGTVRLWDAETGRPRGRPLRPDDTPVLGDTRPVRVGFGPPSGGQLVTATKRSVSLWNAATGEPLGQLLRREDPSSILLSLAFSRDGAVRAIASDTTVWLWDPAEGRFRGDLIHDPGTVRGLTLSPDGSLLATAGAGEPTVQLWEIPSGKGAVPALLHPASAEALAFGPPGSKLLVTLSGDMVRFWNTSTGKPHADPPPTPGGVAALAISPDGQIVATAAANGTVHLWAVAAPPPCRQLPLPSGATGIASVEEDTLLATYSDDGLRLWSAETGQLLSRRFAPGPLPPGAFSPDGRFFVQRRGRSVTMWQTRTGRPHGRPLRLPQPVRYAALSSHGTVLATVSRSATVELWEPASKRPSGGPLRHPTSGGILEFSPDESLLATAGGDHLHLWETATGRLRVPPIRLAGAPRWVAFSPDSRLLATASQGGGAVAIRSTATGRQIVHPLEHAAPVQRGAFSPDGKLLATVTDENTVRLWNLASGRPAGQPMPHPDMVLALRFSPDGKRLATASQSGARLWDVTTCQPVSRPLLATEPVLDAQFGLKGRVLALRAGGPGKVYLSRVRATPAGLPAMERLTAVALGVRPVPGGSSGVLPWQEWRHLRDGIQRSGAGNRSAQHVGRRAVTRTGQQR